MVFSSSLFLVYFLPLFLLVYHLSPKVAKNYVILAASLAFYAWGAPTFIFILLGSTVLDFYIVKSLHAAGTKRRRNWLLTASLAMNLGLLLYFKYANFFVENVNALLGSLGVTELAWTSVLLPIGISFYTFQTLTYSIDVYRREHAPLKRLTDYLLYIMSFPQMIAGPIVRFNLIADQITNRSESIDDKLLGFIRFCIGLAKKVLIANVMAEQADMIMDQDPETLSSATAWIGILAYTMQIYFDFSGYSDMAIGLGRIMGFTFPENFNSPYTSKSITEFWRRWHITLGAWMRDYLYIPLGGNRVKTIQRLYFNLWFVFLVSGLWHGASWNFVIWGAYHGLFLILDRIFLVKLLRPLGKVPRIAFTFLLVVIGWVFFRIESFEQATGFIGRMFSFVPEGSLEVHVIADFWPVFWVAVFFSLLTLVPAGKRMEEWVFERKSYPLGAYFGAVALCLLLFVLSLGAITASGFNPFIYFRF